MIWKSIHQTHILRKVNAKLCISKEMYTMAIRIFIQITNS